MNLLKVFLVSLLMFISSSNQDKYQVSSFWLTDMTIFQPPVGLNSNNNDNNNNKLLQQEQQGSVKTSVEPAVEQSQLTKSAQKSSLSVTKIDNAIPWVPKVLAKDGKTQSIEMVQQQQQQQQQLQQQQQYCQCSNDWLENQTSFWLNKWLESPNSANQIRALLSNSTDALQVGNNIGFGSKRDSSNSNRHQHHGSKMTQNSAANNYWNVWSRPSSRGADNGNGRNTTQHSSRTSRRHSLQQLQNPSKLMMQGESGPPGPKGEPGARGERGERGEKGEAGFNLITGLISVKDRDGLFDLAAELSPSPSSTPLPSPQSTSSPASESGITKSSEENSINKKQVEKRKLVFIEAEQMLVLNTDSGWRPIQLLAPLRDFRKTIAKFSLNSPEERQKLLLMAQRNDQQKQAIDNSIKPSIIHYPRYNIGSGGLRNQVIDANSLFDNEDVDDDGDNEDEEDDEDDDDEDDNEDEDDDDDVGNNKYVNRISGALGNKNKLKLDENIDDNDEEETEQDDNAEPDSKAKFIGSINEEKSKLDSQQTNKKKTSPSSHTQISGRSLAAALVSASIDNSITVKPSPLVHYKHRELSQGNEERIGDKQMKLRLAALNEPFSGNIHGIRGADFECKRNAARANVKGSFRAFLASGFQNLNEIVRHNVNKYPIVNLRGESLANSWHDLFKQTSRIGNPMSKIYSFDGRHVATNSNWPNKLIWHGASNKAGHRDSTHNCDGWHSDSLSKFAYATPIHPPHGNSKKRLHKRFMGDNVEQSQADNITTSVDHQHHMNGQHQSGAFLNTIEKYSCKMPLIVLCIETIGQHLDLVSKMTSFNNNPLENNNLILA